MNFKSRVLFFFVCFAAIHASIQQPMPKRSGRPSGGQRASSVKRQGITRQHQAPDVDYSANESDECRDVTVDTVDDEIALAHSALELHGDKRHMLSFHDDDHKDHCKDATENLETLWKHLNCIPGLQGKALRIIGKGFKEAVHNRCTSKKWHNEYIKFSHCISDVEIYDEYHYCKYRFGAAQEYILKEIPEEDQAFVLTCDVVPRLENCMQRYVGKHCGRKVADFIVDSIWAPYLDYMNYSAGGDVNKMCYTKYPDALSEFDRIYSSKPRELKMGWWKIFFKIARNSYKEMPRYY